MCFTGGHGRRIVTPASVSISNYGLQSHEMLWNWGKIKCICLSWGGKWRGWRIQDWSTTVFNDLSSPRLSGGSAIKLAREEITVYEELEFISKPNECTNIYCVTSNVQYYSSSCFALNLDFILWFVRCWGGSKHSFNSESRNFSPQFLRPISTPGFPFCFATSATRIGKTPK